MFRKTLAAAALSLVFFANVQAAPLSFQSKTLEAKSCDGKNSEGKPLCHQLTVGYPITGDKHLDNWAKKQMGGKLPTQKSVQTTLIRDKDVKETNRENRKLSKDGGYPCALDYVDTLELEGYTPNYAVFGQEDWEYTCGAHGNGVHTLTVLKRGIANPKPLKLNDILLPNQEGKLTHLLEEAYVKYLKENSDDTEEEARNYISGYNSDKFSATENWRFDKNGLTFLYQSYEIGAYVLGRPEFTIPTKDLQGIVKPEILKEAEHFIQPKK